MCRSFAWRTALSAGLVAGTLAAACRPADQRPLTQSTEDGAASQVARTANKLEALSSSKCVNASDLPAPPRKVHDSRPQLSDLRGRQTYSGVLLFEVTIGPSGDVINVRLVNTIDTQEPWPTIAARWKSAVSEWRYAPATVNKNPSLRLHDGHH